MADEKKEKREQNEQNSSLDFFLDFMKKRKEQEAQQTPKTEKKERTNNIKSNILEAVSIVIDAINHVIEDILMDDRKSKWLSLALALALLISVNGASITTNTERTIENVPVEIRNLNMDYAITGVPDSVTLKLTGNIVNLQSTLYKEQYKAYVDLADLNEGTYNLNIKVEGLPSGISVVPSPNSVNVTLSPKESRLFALGYRFINEGQKDAKYVLEPPTLSRSEVAVTASAETLNAIRSVEAVIDVSNVTQTFTQKAAIKAYDESNNELNVSIDPETVDVTVNVTSSSKQVPVKINKVGKMEDNLAVASLTADPSTVTIYGKKDILDQIDSIAGTIDVSQIDSNKEVYGVSLELPEGVSNASQLSVSVNVVVEYRIIKPIHNIQVEVLNNTNNYKITYNNTISCEVSGAASRVSVLDESTITASINVKDLAPGEYEVPINIKSSDTLLDVYSLNGEMMSIVIE